jgi:hypothetical protein
MILESINSKMNNFTMVV